MPRIPVSFSTRRRTLCAAGASFLFLFPCKARPVRVRLNISLFSYVDRPIYDVMMNSTNFMGASAHGFYGSNAVLLGQTVTLGPQVVTWKLGGPKGMERNGETVTAKNTLTLDSVPNDAKWLGLHIYDDATVEIKFSRGAPDELQTERGRAVIESWNARRDT